jgi:hypothetical protein
MTVVPSGSQHEYPIGIAASVVTQWREIMVPAFENVSMSVYDPFVGSSQRAVTDAAKVDMATVNVLLLPCGK